MKGTGVRPKCSRCGTQLRQGRQAGSLCDPCLPATVESQAVTEREGGWVERRDFIQHVAGLALGFGATGIDVDRLRTLLPQAEPTGFRQVGHARAGR